MSSITPRQAQDYLDRWKVARQRQVLESQGDSLAIRGRQLGVLMASAALFSADPHRLSGEDLVRERWRRIRLAFDA